MNYEGSRLSRVTMYAGAKDAYEKLTAGGNDQVGKSQPEVSDAHETDHYQSTPAQTSIGIGQGGENQ